MPNVDPLAVSTLGDQIEKDVTSILTESNEHLGKLGDITTDLYTSVEIQLAVAYTIAVPFMTEAANGTAEAFKEMNAKITACASAWSVTEDGVCRTFGG